ncbi:hypothetical protein V8E36_000098 [Tilletia maclaganii]
MLILHSCLLPFSSLFFALLPLLHSPTFSNGSSLEGKCLSISGSTCAEPAECQSKVCGMYNMCGRDMVFGLPAPNEYTCGGDLSQTYVSGTTSTELADGTFVVSALPYTMRVCGRRDRTTYKKIGDSCSSNRECDSARCAFTSDASLGSVCTLQPGTGGCGSNEQADDFQLHLREHVDNVHFLELHLDRFHLQSSDQDAGYIIAINIILLVLDHVDQDQHVIVFNDVQGIVYINFLRDLESKHINFFHHLQDEPEHNLEGIHDVGHHEPQHIRLVLVDQVFHFRCYCHPHPSHHDHLTPIIINLNPPHDDDDHHHPRPSPKLPPLRRDLFRQSVLSIGLLPRQAPGRWDTRPRDALRCTEGEWGGVLSECWV